MILYQALPQIAVERVAVSAVALVTSNVAPATITAQSQPAAASDPQQQSDAVKTEADTGPVLRGPNGEKLTPEQERAMRALIEKNPALKMMMQQAGASDNGQPGSDQQVTVTATRLRGSADADLPPLRVYRPEDITALGAGSLADLVQKLRGDLPASAVGGNSAPVVLLNGRRIASFTEVADIPSEAVLRTEIFPPEVAVRYGFLPTQNVVNIVLLERFVTRVVDATVSIPTAGGYDKYSGMTTLFRVKGDTRLNVSLHAQTNTSLSDNQRGIIEPSASYGAPETRDLLPAESSFAADATLAARLVEPVVSTFNLHFDSNLSNTRLGVFNGTGIGQRTLTDKAHFSTTQAGIAHNWQWTLSATGDQTVTRTDTSSGPLFGSASARSIDTLVDVRLLLAGSPLNGPAGPIGTTFSIGDDNRRFGSSMVPDSSADTVLHRNQASVTASLSVPIADRSKQVLPGLGYVSLNGNVALNRLSDFGTLTSYGYGLHWTPLAGVNLSADKSHAETAPTLEQLDAPLISTPNVPYFDLLTGQTVSIDQISGGNSMLRSQHVDAIRLGLAVKPFKTQDFNVIVDYTASNTRHPIAMFPLGIPAVQASLPGRFQRDPSGTLTLVDATALNFDRRRTRLIRMGFNFSHTLGSTPADLKGLPVTHVGSEEDIKRVLPPGATAVEVAPGSAEASEFDVLTSRILISLYFTHRLDDQLWLAPGVSSLDLLDGAAIDYLGGTPRNEIRGEIGLYKKGIGLNVSGNWHSGTHVLGLAGDGPIRLLSFRQYGTVNASAFADLGVLLQGGSLARALGHFRVSLVVTNLIDQHPSVIDALNATPLGYQQGYLDPVGRTVAFNVRARF